MIERINASNFTWDRWRSFNLFDEFKIACRYEDIIRFKYIIKQYAVGYADSTEVPCRPKENCFAIMFLYKDIYSWCHLTAKEFEKVFGG